MVAYKNSGRLIKKIHLLMYLQNNYNILYVTGEFQIVLNHFIVNRWKDVDGYLLTRFLQDGFKFTDFYAEAVACKKSVERHKKRRKNAIN